MELNEYQKKAEETAFYPDGQRILYPALGLTGEAGEVSDKVKKVLRARTVNSRQLQRKRLQKNLAMCCGTLLCRKLRGKLGGSGDNG